MEDSYRIYVTDSLRLKAEGKYISKRWWAIVHPAQEDADPEAIISDIIERAGLEVTHNESSGPSGQDHLR